MLTHGKFLTLHLQISCKRASSRHFIHLVQLKLLLPIANTIIKPHLSIEKLSMFPYSTAWRIAAPLINLTLGIATVFSSSC